MLAGIGPGRIVEPNIALLTARVSRASNESLLVGAVTCQSVPLKLELHQACQPPNALRNGTFCSWFSIAFFARCRQDFIPLETAQRRLTNQVVPAKVEFRQVVQLADAL